MVPPFSITFLILASFFFFFFKIINSEDYDDESATAHVRRVLDLVACTTSFGASPAGKDQNTKTDASSYSAGGGNGKSEPGAQVKNNGQKSSISTTSKAQGSSGGNKQDVAVDSEAEMSHSCPKLGAFYEFFSLSHLTPPLQCINTHTLSLSRSFYIYTYNYICMI